MMGVEQGYDTLINNQLVKVDVILRFLSSIATQASLEILIHANKMI